MSVVLRITAPGQEDRIVPLDSGESKIGAALTCDLLMLDESVADEHFILRVSDEAISLTLLPGAQAELDGNDMRPGAEILLTKGMKIAVGDAVLTFRGGIIDEPTGKTTAKPAADVAIWSGLASSKFPSFLDRKFSGLPYSPRSQLAGAGALAACLAAAVWIGFGIKGPDARVEASQSLMFDGCAKDNPDPRCKGQGGASEPVNRFISDLPQPDAQQAEDPANVADLAEVSTERVLKASAIVLSGIDQNTEAESIEDGVLHVSGLRPDDPNVDDIRRALLADVPSLTDVTFSLNSEDRITALKAQVAGVWAGKRPFVVRTDGEVIKPSQELHDGVILVGVSEKHIDVAIGPDQHKVALQ